MALQSALIQTQCTAMATSGDVNTKRLITVGSYNLHGFNQGVPILKMLCNEDQLNFDVLFIQEHWLTPNNISQLENFSNSYSFCGISAMSDSVSRGVLLGRPYGGTGIMIKNDLAKYVTS